MCGICGFFLRRPDAIAGAGDVIASAAGALVARGPDGTETWSDDRVHLGHTRLAIIDRQGGAQPMVSHESGSVLVFNGEIYNFKELRRDLSAKGLVFRTESDTEVLLAAYDAYGVECVEKIDGMFAFAVWDPRTKAIFLARDRVGKKPLYYCDTPEYFAFASEPKALLQIPNVAKAAEVDPLAMSDFLSLGYILTPKSGFRNIRRFPAGHKAVVKLMSDGVRPTEYWPIAEHYLARNTSDHKTQLAEFGRLLDDAVAKRMHADVPIGLYLSGGVDSAAVAESVTRVSRNWPSAYCVSFDDRSFDESNRARLTAKHLGIHLEILEAEDGRHLAPDFLISSTDEPFADTSLLPCLTLNKTARRDVTVALSGDGADELFAGYPTYLANALYAGYRFVPKPLHDLARTASGRLVRPSYRKVGWDYKLRQFLRGHGLDRRRAHYSWRTIFSEEEKVRLMHPDMAEACAQYDPFDSFLTHFERVDGADFLSQCLYVDLKTWLQDDILVKVDRASMTYGLEVRSPFLDYRMVEFAASLPSSAKFGWLQRKKLLRNHLQGRVPSEIVSGGKHGFSAPTDRFSDVNMIAAQAQEWLRDDIRLDAVSEDVTFKRFVLVVLNAFAATRIAAR